MLFLSIPLSSECPVFLIHYVRVWRSGEFSVNVRTDVIRNDIGGIGDIIQNATTTDVDKNGM